jgi:small-conductance mechanosensitive channel
MSTVTAQLTGSRVRVDWTPVRETLSLLRSGQESIDLFVGQLFGELDRMRDRLEQQERKLREERNQLSEDRRAFEDQQGRSANIGAGGSHADPASSNDLERERAELETELEAVRQRCEELSETVAEQKRQLTDERAEWTAEFRQLRKILDKQSQLLAQRMEPVPGVPTTTTTVNFPHMAAASTAPATAGVAVASAPAAQNAGTIDPVLGSVMNQFQMLQKDAARRRQQQVKR